MKLNRRELLSKGSLLAIFGALPKAVSLGAKTAKEHIRETVIKVYRKTVPLNVDVPKFDVRTGVPIADLWLSIDHPRQHLACTCEYSLDGKVLHACEEGSKLSHNVANTAGDFWKLVKQHIPEDVLEREYKDLWQTWKRFREAETEYRQHYCSGWVGDMRGDDNA